MVIPATSDVSVKFVSEGNFSILNAKGVILCTVCYFTHCTGTISGSIKFREVSFSYPSRPVTPDLKNLSLDVPALVCGKRTLIQLVQRFHDPDTGSVQQDGDNVKDLNFGRLKIHILIVVVQFNLTIRENICSWAIRQYQILTLRRLARRRPIMPSISSISWQTSEIGRQVELMASADGLYYTLVSRQLEAEKMTERSFRGDSFDESRPTEWRDRNENRKEEINWMSSAFQWEEWKKPNETLTEGKWPEMIIVWLVREAPFK